MKQLKGSLKGRHLWPTSNRPRRFDDDESPAGKHGVSGLAPAPIALMDPDVVRQVEALLLEQQALIREMRQFARDVDGGADRDAVLCGDAFRSALGRLTAAQQHQRELLDAARAQITRDHPMLLQQSKQLLELLSTITAEAPVAPRWTVENPPPPPPRPPAAADDAARTANLIDF